MTPLVRLEIAASRIGEGPQADYDMWETLRELRAMGADPETLASAWDWLGRDARTTPGGAIGAWQNLNALMNGIARDIREERLGPVELGAAKIAAAG